MVSVTIFSLPNLETQITQASPRVFHVALCSGSESGREWDYLENTLEPGSFLRNMKKVRTTCPTYSFSIQSSYTVEPQNHRISQIRRDPQMKFKKKNKNIRNDFRICLHVSMHVQATARWCKLQEFGFWECVFLGSKNILVTDLKGHVPLKVTVAIKSL